MKTQCGVKPIQNKVRANSILFILRRLRGRVELRFLALLTSLYPGKESIEQGDMWATRPGWTCGKEKDLLELLAIEPEFCGIVASGLVTIVTELICLYHAGFCSLQMCHWVLQSPAEDTKALRN